MTKKKLLLLISLFISSLLWAQKTTDKKLVKELTQTKLTIRIYRSTENTFSYTISIGQNIIISDEKMYGLTCSCKFKTQIDAEQKAMLVCRDISEKGIMPITVGNKN